MRAGSGGGGGGRGGGRRGRGVVEGQSSAPGGRRNKERFQLDECWFFWKCSRQMQARGAAICGDQEYLCAEGGGGCVNVHFV